MRAPWKPCALACLLLLVAPLSLGGSAPALVPEGPQLAVLGSVVRTDAPFAPAQALALPPSAQAGRVLFVDRDPVGVSQQVRLAGDGSVGYGSWWLNNAHIAKYSRGGPAWTLSAEPYGIQHGLGAGKDATVASAILDVAGSLGQAGGLGVGTWLLGGGPAPTFTHPTPPCCEGLTDVSDLGLVATASHRARYGPGDTGQVEVAPLGAAAVWSASFSDDVAPLTPFRQLQGLDISADSTTIAVTTYNNVFVFRLPGTSPVAIFPNKSQTPARVSGDGHYVAVGGFQFKAYLYERLDDGSYRLRWSRDVGHPWVTSVAVADDGTVLAGTFEYRGTAGGKVTALAGVNGATRWECVCYGDFVNQVQVTPDGSRAAAVSWGTFGGPGGDVLTAYEGRAGQVLYRLSSGIDEPGSLFGLDLGADGKTLLAGGKAVHARQFGNGGMVYGIALD